MAAGGGGLELAMEARAARVVELLFADPAGAQEEPAGAAPGDAAAPDDASPQPMIDGPRSRALVAWYGELLDVHRLGARALAEQNLTQGNAAGGSDAATELGAADALLRTVHRALLEHPIAARSIFAGFVEEGRRYAATPEGAELRARLARSRAVHRAALLWRTVTMGMLSETEEPGLPSAYLDNLARLSADPSLERILAGLAAGRGAR